MGWGENEGGAACCLQRACQKPPVVNHWPQPRCISDTKAGELEDSTSVKFRNGQSSLWWETSERASPCRGGGPARGGGGRAVTGRGYQAALRGGLTEFCRLTGGSQLKCEFSQTERIGSKRSCGILRYVYVYVRVCMCVCANLSLSLCLSVSNSSHLALYSGQSG